MDPKTLRGIDAYGNSRAKIEAIARSRWAEGSTESNLPALSALEWVAKLI